MAHGKFGTAINCMDGRVQEPVIRWLKETYGLDYVDMITEPGPEKVLAEGGPQAAAILAKLRISAQAHGSQVLAIVAHDDCAGNPVSPDVHQAQVRQAMQVLRGWGLPMPVIGLWVDAQWLVQEVRG